MSEKHLKPEVAEQLRKKLKAKPAEESEFEKSARTGRYVESRLHDAVPDEKRLGKLYTSPSLAGAAACRRSTCNGWTFWEFERAP